MASSLDVNLIKDSSGSVILKLSMFKLSSTLFGRAIS